MAQGDLNILSDEMFALQLQQETLMDPDEFRALDKESTTDPYGNVDNSSFFDINNTENQTNTNEYKNHNSLDRDRHQNGWDRSSHKSSYKYNNNDNFVSGSETRSSVSEHNVLTQSIQQSPTKNLHDNLQPNDQSGDIRTNPPSPQLVEAHYSVLTDEAIARHMQEECYQGTDSSAITDEMLAMRLQEESVRTLTDVEIAQQLQQEHSVEDDERLAMQLVQEDTSVVNDEILARRLQEGDTFEQGDCQTDILGTAWHVQLQPGDSDEFIARQLQEEDTPAMSDELLARHLQDKDNADDEYLARELQKEESPGMSDELLARQLQENDNVLENDEHLAKELQDMADRDAEMARRFQEEEYEQAGEGQAEGEWQSETDNEESYNEDSYIGPDDVNPETDDYEELMELQERVGDVSRGLAKADIERFPITIHSADNMTTSTQAEGNTCSICLTDFHAGDRKRRLTCLHCFHVVCVDQWLKNNPTCPVCRVEMNTE